VKNSRLLRMINIRNGITKKVLVSLSGLVFTTFTTAQTMDADAFAEQAVTRLSEYLQIDTVNPPGNEARAVAYFKNIFDQAGITYTIVESAPGRSNIVARLKGGEKPGLILLNHTDVVPFDESEWDQPPLSGKIVDGVLYGRGAADMKNVAIIQLQAFLWLHQSGLPLNRDIVFAATADEEAGGNLGAGYLVKHNPELFAGMGYALNEGGGGRQGKPPVFSISVTEKLPFWLRITAKGMPGHGSVPVPNGAVEKLITGLDNFQNADREARVSPVVREYLRMIAPSQKGEYKAMFANIDAAIREPGFVAKLIQENPRVAAILTNTCSITRLEASNKINVIPNAAWAELDCRLLPDQDKAQFKQWLIKQMNVEGLEVEEILTFAAASSSMDSDLYSTINGLLQDSYPNAMLLPTMTTGFTDSHWFREIGIESYGFIPSLSHPKKDGGFHGNNERISVDNLKESTLNMIELLRRFTSN